MVWVVGQVVNYIPKSFFFSFLHSNCLPWAISWLAGDAPSSLEAGWAKRLSWKKNVIGSHMCKLHTLASIFYIPFPVSQEKECNMTKPALISISYSTTFKRLMEQQKKIMWLVESSCTTEQPPHPALPTELGCLIWNIWASI